MIIEDARRSLLRARRKIIRAKALYKRQVLKKRDEQRAIDTATRARH